MAWARLFTPAGTKAAKAHFRNCAADAMACRTPRQAVSCHYECRRSLIFSQIRTASGSLTTSTDETGRKSPTGNGTSCSFSPTVSRNASQCVRIGSGGTGEEIPPRSGACLCRDRVPTPREQRLLGGPSHRLTAIAQVDRLLGLSSERTNGLGTGADAGECPSWGVYRWGMFTARDRGETAWRKRSYKSWWNRAFILGIGRAVGIRRWPRIFTPART